MQFRSLRTELIYDTIKSEISTLNEVGFPEVFFSKSIQMIKKEYPQLNEEEVLSIIELVGNALLEKREEQIGLVATVPVSFSLKTKRIQNVAEELIENAKKSIMLTGYAVSNFISKIIDLLIEKSQKGVLVKIFLNDTKSQLSIKKILEHKSKFLQVYDYTNIADKMSALHAKIIVADGKELLISSANLSYHGMAGNIEIGTCIKSEKIAKQIEELFKDLLFNKIFKSVDTILSNEIYLNEFLKEDSSSEFKKIFSN